MAGKKSAKNTVAANRRHILYRHMFIHRGYRVFPKEAGWNTDHQLWRMFPQLPLRFHWHDREDRGGLLHYIDCLYKGDALGSNAYERKGCATGIIFPMKTEVEKLQNVEVNVRRLIDCLKLTDTFQVPLWSRVHFVTDGHHLVASDFISVLANAFPQDFGQLDASQPWRTATAPDLETQGIRPEELSSGHNLQQPAEAGAVEGAADASLPERTIRRLDHGDWIDWITEVRGGDQRWFTRRCYRESEIFYEATAWSIDGPWHVTLRNTSVMLALGVTL